MFIIIALSTIALLALLWWRFSGNDKHQLSAPKLKAPVSLVKTSIYDVSEFVEYSTSFELETLEEIEGYEADPLIEEDNLLEILEQTSTSSYERPEEEKEESPEQIPPVMVEETNKEELTAIEEELPAMSLYHNPITADAPTENDKLNRKAANELRKRKRNELKVKAREAGKALGEIFSQDAALQTSDSSKHNTIINP